MILVSCVGRRKINMIKIVSESQSETSTVESIR